MAKAPVKTVAGIEEPRPQAQAAQASAQQVEEVRRFGRELSDAERAAAAVGASARPALDPAQATKFRCATTDGLSAIVEKLGGGKYRVRMERLHRGDAEQPAVEIDLGKLDSTSSVGPDLRPMPAILVHGDGTPRQEPVAAFMAAAGIRASSRMIGCTPLE